MSYRIRHFPDRDVGGDARLDHRLDPLVRWTHHFGRGRPLRGTYDYDRRFSNDPDREFGGPRFELRLSAIWDP